MHFTIISVLNVERMSIFLALGDESDLSDMRVSGGRQAAEKLCGTGGKATVEAECKTPGWGK